MTSTSHACTCTTCTTAAVHADAGTGIVADQAPAPARRRRRPISEFELINIRNAAGADSKFGTSHFRDCRNNKHNEHNIVNN